jgi:membrane-bound lytic murein transglycosylase D
MQVARRLESDVSVIPDHPEATVTVRMQNFVSAQSLVSYFKVSRQDFTRLNPSLRAPVLEGNKYIPKNYLLRLPATKLIKTLTQKIPSHLYHFSQIPDTLYKVRSGDTISAIAAKYKVTAKMIIQLNNLDSKATIRTGQQLKIPINTLKKEISVLNKTSKQK